MPLPPVCSALAHLLLQTRSRVINGDLDDLIRCRYPAFRMPFGTEAAPGL
jgi:hypothetical protein